MLISRLIRRPSGSPGDQLTLPLNIMALFCYRTECVEEREGGRGREGGFNRSDEKQMVSAHKNSNCPLILMMIPFDPVLERSRGTMHPPLACLSLSLSPLLPQPLASPYLALPLSHFFEYLPYLPPTFSLFLHSYLTLRIPSYLPLFFPSLRRAIISSPQHSFSPLLHSCLTPSIPPLSSPTFPPFSV